MRHDAVRRALIGAAALGGAGGVALAAQRLGGAEAPATPPPADVADPRAYGASLDGTTDDSAALVRAAGAGRPVLVRGSLRIDRPVDLPPETQLLGAGVYRSTLMLGAEGSLRMAGKAFGRRAGGGVIRDLTIGPVGRANAGAGLVLRHVEHMLFDNVTFYRIDAVLDDHHHLGFRDCRFFGDAGRNTLRSTCASQPDGQVAISEAPAFTRCLFGDCPVVLEDTVGARFTDTTVFSGAWGVRSTRRLALGTDAQPFFMGPVVSGCTFDSIDGPALDLDGGGTDCRIVNTLVSAGRRQGAPGVRLAGCSGVELVGNRFEWCGGGGLVLVGCEGIGVSASTFVNMKHGPGIGASRSRTVRVVGNAFENRPRWGGSGNGNTSLAIEADAACADWLVTANTAVGLRDPRVAVLAGGIVRDNIGWSAA